MISRLGGKMEILRDFTRYARRRTHHVTALSAVTQGMIDEDQRQHGFGNRRGANADTRIVPPLGRHFDGVALTID